MTVNELVRRLLALNSPTAEVRVSCYSYGEEGIDALRTIELDGDVVYLTNEEVSG